jgi:hypothetical protein
LVVAEEKIQEFIKLKTEFETEFKIAEVLADKLTHKYFPFSETGLYDTSLKESLNDIGVKYSMLITSISRYKLFNSK